MIDPTFGLPAIWISDENRERAERAKGRDIISLAVGDPDIPTDRRIVADAAKELKNGRNHRYPNTKGNERLRKAVAEPLSALYAEASLHAPRVPPAIALTRDALSR